ncbi:hypothetical protein D3C79_1003310 [compost metagenome]
MICAIPIAKVGAPPVRDKIEVSPTSCANSVNISGVTTNPKLRTASAADSTVVPSTAAGALIAKYTPGSKTVAQIIAIIPTKDSMSMPP